MARCQVGTFVGGPIRRSERGGKKENQTSTRCPKFTWRSQSVMFVFDSRSACFLGRRPARAHESHGKVCRRRRHFLIHGKHVHSYTRCCNLANQTECFRNHLDLSCTYIWLTGHRELFSEKGRQNLEDDGTDHLCIAFSYQSDFIYLFIYSLALSQTGSRSRTLKGGTPVDGLQCAAALSSTQLLPTRVGRNAKTNLPKISVPVLFSFNVTGNIRLLVNCCVHVSSSCWARRHFLFFLNLLLDFLRAACTADVS